MLMHALFCLAYEFQMVPAMKLSGTSFDHPRSVFMPLPHDQKCRSHRNKTLGWATRGNRVDQQTVEAIGPII